MTDRACVVLRIEQGVAVLHMVDGPLNVLGPSMREQLLKQFDRLDADHQVAAVVLTGTEQVFLTGPELSGYDTPDERCPTLSQLCRRIEDMTKPVIALVRGLAQRCGAELALSAHYRLATDNLRFVFSHVAFGLVPNGGGTQRLARLVGPQASLRLLLSGQSIAAGPAEQIGLIDRIVTGDPEAGAVAFAQELDTSDVAAARSRNRRAHLADGKNFLATVARARAALPQKHTHGLARLVDCVEAALLLPFDAGLAFEADAYARCLVHPQSQALRHVYAAERRCDPALLRRENGHFEPEVPMGKSAVIKLAHAYRAAADHLVNQGTDPQTVDAAMVSFGFQAGPFGTAAKPQTRDDIARRIIAALMRAGLDLVHEQAVERPSDVDALAVHGLGFPRQEGGPLHAAQTMGLIGLRRDMREWAAENPLWLVPDLMDDAIKTGGRF